MKIIDKRLLETSQAIDKHLEQINKENRAEESSEILLNIRNYCECVLYKIYDEENNADLYQTQENLKTVRTFIKQFNNKFDKIHQLFDCSGHINFGIEQSEALMIKYIPMLISLKVFIKKRYNVDTLMSISKYPLNLDNSLIKFYRKILQGINTTTSNDSLSSKNLYYVRKKTLKYIDNQVFYEYVLDISDDRPNKFNTVVAYSILNIDLNYDMTFKFFRKSINFLDTNITINIITDYDIFIRPCSFKTLAYLINIDLDIKSRSQSYYDLMRKIKENEFTLLDIIENNVTFTERNDLYNTFISKIREFISRDNFGTKLVKYLLLNMRYSNIKGQVNKYLYKNSSGISSIYNPFYDNLKIASGSLGFEYNPIAFSPLVESPSIEDLSRILDLNNYEHEFLYRRIENYINNNNSLFVDKQALNYSDEKLQELINLFNSKLYDYYADYKIIKVYDKYTIKFYYDASIRVLEKISKLANNKSITLNYPTIENTQLSDDKNQIIKKAFKDSSICVVTGAAGTGKTTLIHEYININYDKKILCLTTTNTAKNNLKVDKATNVTYKNTSEYTSNKNQNSCNEYDLIIIDEAAFVPTAMIDEILYNNPDVNYLIVGDPYQIESIQFGNWFKLILELFKGKDFIFSLDKNHRAETNELQKVWDSVRFLDGNDENKILELTSTFEFARKISNEAFKISEKQVVLCLNYDGLYGINNLNRYLQCMNSNDEYIYQQNIYKVDDPVVFIINDFDCYGLYNNMKGTIKKIFSENDYITFHIELDKKIEDYGILSNEISIDNSGEKSVIVVSKHVPAYEEYDNELSYRSKLPFQLAYAMSIHKAQGLEFEKVKIIITSDTEEYISKNIFYTAITRAKKQLEIYWDPEVPNVLFNNMVEESKSAVNDVSIFKRLIGEGKLNLK